MRHGFSLFDDFFDGFFADKDTNGGRLMPIDVLENEDRFILKADLPGVKKENLNIDIDGNELKIESCLPKEELEEKEVFHLKERFSGCYMRKLKLTDVCDKENIAANFENGVLTLTIPKTKDKLKKQISIS